MNMVILRRKMFKNRFLFSPSYYFFFHDLVMQRLLQMEAKIKSEHLKLNERDIFLNQELELFDKIDLKKQEQEMTNKVSL